MSKWIWFYGDYELYHSFQLHTRREEKGAAHPPLWRLDDCHHAVVFRKEVEVAEDTVILPLARGAGRLEVAGRAYPIGRPVTVPKGRHLLQADVMNPHGLPCLYIDSDVIPTDESWEVHNKGRHTVKAGCRDEYTRPTDDPQRFPFVYDEILPQTVTPQAGGVLYDFGRETFAVLEFAQAAGEVDVFYGESVEEALDTAECTVRDRVSAPCRLPARAFRYLYLTGAPENYRFCAFYEHLPVKNKAAFCCSDETVNAIWDTALYTFELNSREFYLDGIKRDRWVWSGDAYQSYLIDRYCFFDTDIIRRTVLALRGCDPVETHLNTILDYSFYWLISVGNYYEMTGDAAFVRRLYPRMKGLMDYCLSRLDAEGFAGACEGDWIFIDWAEMDKDGALCAEQWLFLKSLETMAFCARLVGAEDSYTAPAEELRQKIPARFWDEEQGAFIDTFESGRRQVTRHANIFALLFGYADEAQQAAILQNVLKNEAVPAITTPYFKFYELEALCQTGHIDEVTARIKAYWGGMLAEGATTFWEEYDPTLHGAAHYDMYGKKYNKSLCHAWGASPVYLLGRYYLGVRPTAPGYASFEVRPCLGGLEWMEGTVPLNGGAVDICWRAGQLTVTASRNGGTLVCGGQSYPLPAGKTVTISVK